MGSTRRCRCHLLVSLWRSTQVKQHGSYSAARVQDLAKYERVASSTRAVAVVLATPLPCLAVTLFIDWLPLSPPSEGIHSNKLFLLREFYAYLVMTLLALHQFRTGVPVLPYPTRKLIRDTLLVSGLSIGILYASILIIGFPLPFTTLTLVPPWAVLIVVCLGVQWAKIMRETGGAVAMSIGMVKLWVCDILLGFIYPPYFYVFSSLATKDQIVFVLLLPVIKVLMRKLFSRAVQHLGDETPVLVVFNADVFGSLFMAYCMQRSPSTWTTTGIMALDVVTMAISLRDVHTARKELKEMERQLDKAHAWRSHAGAMGHISLGRRMPTTLERASILLDQTAGEYGPTIDSVDFADKNRMIDSYQSGKKIAGLARIYPAHQAVAVGRRSPNAVVEASYTLKVRRLLYMAEFLLLLNYVEVITPLVFSVYLAATYCLPNRDYYAIYNGMDQHQLFQTLQNVLLYCILQMGSFCLLVVMLRRMLGLSPMKHIGFVLAKQVDFVQISLVFWLFYNVQSSLQHIGYDYSFRFAWLSEPPNS